MEIRHVVVVMLENRSFDHMLGYLSLPPERGGRGRDMDGLTEEWLDRSVEVEGRTYAPRPLTRPALTESEDPSHGGSDVHEQISGGMRGYVQNYIDTHPNLGDHGLVLEYCTASDVPVYDFLAEHYCVCDHWFSSVPGATWPNRLYALTGSSDGQRDNVVPPLYDGEAFVRHLDGHASWRWYSTDPGTLRAVDRRYRLVADERFASFEKPSLLASRTFFRDVKAGELAQLSWIDPNFVDLGGAPGANDDHPPASLLAGQELVLKIYTALSRSELWDRTLLLVTYDEHGGFFDHVDPPEAEDESERMRRYGPRVPALIASPWIHPGFRESTVFDHTSIIKTALKLFRPDAADRIAGDMGRRVAAAADFLQVLDGSGPRPAPAIPDAVRDPIVEWRAQAARDALENPVAAYAEGMSVVSPVKAVRRGLREILAGIGPAIRAALSGQPRLIGYRPHETPVQGHTELTQEMLSLAQHVRAEGLPPGRV